MYNPFDWYWQADDGRIFSSARQELVAEDDAGLNEWRDAGRFPTVWPRDDGGNQSDSALQEVLAPFGLYAGLSNLCQGLKAAVDAAAESERQKYITQGAGQAMTYQRKLEEAKRAAQESSPSASSYPFLAASIGIDGEDIAAVAQTVLSMDAQWALIGSAIEAERLRVKAAISAAETAEEAQAAFAAITWPVMPET